MKKILIDPGHGLYYDETQKKYIFQREQINGVIEDVLTIYTANKLIPKLSQAGFDVLYTRDYTLNPRLSPTTKKPEYFDGAFLYLSEDLPKKISTDFTLDGLNITDNYKKDVNCRFIYANKINKTIPISLLLSIHYNAGVPAANGVETWYHNGNSNMKKLATLLSNQTARICGLKNRGANGEDQIYAALKIPDMNSLIWEVAFFTSVSDVFKIKQKDFYDKVTDAAVNVISFADKNGII